MALAVRAPAGDDWLLLSGDALPFDLAMSWPVTPACGALVIFAGTVRDHADGRPGVVSLEYEAYASAALLAMAELGADLRRQWPVVGRVVLWHRTGLLLPTEVSVVTAVSAPHRAEAFEAARLAIDALKSRVPIWKHETWDGGNGWALDGSPLQGAGAHMAGVQPTGG